MDFSAIFIIKMICGFTGLKTGEQDLPDFG
jgi:hypothetical protein